jgi:hypothetical protein
LNDEHCPDGVCHFELCVGKYFYLIDLANLDLLFLLHTECIVDEDCKTEEAPVCNTNATCVGKLGLKCYL